MIGCAGHPHVKTPNLDHLAEQGAFFRQAYCTNPICTPSRMSFITGRYTHQINVPNNGFPLDPDIMTWPRKLSEKGIHSTMFGKMDFCGDYQSGGFTDYRIIRRRPLKAVKDETGKYVLKQPCKTRLKDAKRWWGLLSKQISHAGGRTSRIIEEAAEYGERDDFIGNYDHDKMITQWVLEDIKEKGKKHSKQPWAIYVGLVYPHSPFTVPQKYFDLYYPNNFEIPVDFNPDNENLHPAMKHFQEVLGIGKPSENDIRRVMAAYYGMITCMDEMIGEILEELEEQGMLDDTYIIYTSDHGEALGEHGLFHKSSPYDGSCGVPLIIKGPDIPQNQEISQPVSLVDMYPTILDMMEVDAVENESGPGHSWLPIARGEANNHPGYAFAEYHGHMNRYDWYMLFKENYKYIWYSNGLRPSLFKLKEDPDELEDLAGKEEYQPVLKQFERQLRTIINPEQVTLESKKQLGLISKRGEDYTEIMTCEDWELAWGRN